MLCGHHKMYLFACITTGITYWVKKAQRAFSVVLLVILFIGVKNKTEVELVYSNRTSPVTKSDRIGTFIHLLSASLLNKAQAGCCQKEYGLGLYTLAWF